MDKQIITRFPPSPSGYLHLGGARTAIFNWLYARHTNGHFVLRVEDTDVARSTKESVNAILDALEWLGIGWDEGPYFQSQRFDVYKDYINRLLAAGHAYYCTCSAERLEQMRQDAMQSGGKPKYDGTCRDKGLAYQEGAVVRFKAPLAGTTMVPDRIRGNIAFNNTELDDFIIQRSDGTPTYNLAVVVDDITMNINTIIRGDDHLNNTPKQIQLYEALDCEVPDFGHVPMVLGPDKTRLSKRHGAMSVTAYRDMGYHPDAMVNYLVRLGWSHGDQEFFTREELIEKFNLEHIGKSAGVFDPEKLLALNAEHIRAKSNEELAGHLMPFLEAKGIDAAPGEYLYHVIETLKNRSKTFVEMADAAEFYFVETVAYEEKAARKFLKAGILAPLKEITAELEQMEVFNQETLEPIFQRVMDKHELKLGKIAQPMRVALTGKTFSPGIFEMIEVLGKSAVLARLKDAIKYIESRRADE
ncbi:MAG TPA: glutamate--tRNA ligase [Desulfosalsimonadaceae bacterium]|nr:glutamate--tRNA ligase [Desulfosalsimonadaceae bacterium]